MCAARCWPAGRRVADPHGKGAAPRLPAPALSFGKPWAPKGAHAFSPQGKTAGAGRRRSRAASLSYLCHHPWGSIFQVCRLYKGDVQAPFSPPTAGKSKSPPHRGKAFGFLKITPGTSGPHRWGRASRRRRHAPPCRPPPPAGLPWPGSPHPYNRWPP